MKKVKEWISLKIALNPRAFILLMIISFNAIFSFGGAVVIWQLSPPEFYKYGFWGALYYTVGMILDPGSIQNVIPDLSQARVALILFSILTVLFGMVLFSGSIIGYITSYISSFIQNANEGKRKVLLSGHTIILNWNTRASEIINDLLYTAKKEKVVVLVNRHKEEIRKEIEDKISDTIKREKANGIILNRKKMTIIVKEGNSFTMKDLEDISIREAKAIIILGRDLSYGVDQDRAAYNEMLYKTVKNDIQTSLDEIKTDCKRSQKQDNAFRGDAITLKTLIQVNEIIKKTDNNQNIIVEIADKWTLRLVEHIIMKENREGRYDIYPVPVNKILGQILSQFSIMPELNLVYSTLFSHKGASFFAKSYVSDMPEEEYVRNFININTRAIPLTAMTGDNWREFFFVANKESDICTSNSVMEQEISVDVNSDFWLEIKHLILLGHNAKSQSVIEGFDAFSNEWKCKNGEEILDVLIIDDCDGIRENKHNLERKYISRVVEADIYDISTIYSQIEEFILKHEQKISILILSNDGLGNDDQDTFALTYLIYVKDIIDRLEREYSNFERNRIDIVVEILNPKNYDVVQSYDVNNVVISNRYISKMITQIGEKESLYYLYQDILVYDDEDNGKYDSKEIYIKRADRFFNKIPTKSTIHQLIRAVYEVTPPHNKAILVGCINSSGQVLIFTDNQEQEIQLGQEDKLIIFTNH